ncbi:MAG: hypothetical protein OXI73_11985 [Rhodospirillales bacterium]|nr:hypothetical protein [Rhodospirillales bacterium]
MGERIGDRIGNGGGRADGAAFAHAPETAEIVGRRALGVQDADVGKLGRGRR